jgi:DNA-binding MarR family transcriptional regulator
VEPTLQQVGLSVKRLQWQHHRGANTRLAEIGLSLVQWDVLRHLAENPEASLHELATLTFQTDQSMGTLATRMIAAGLIERVPGPGRAIRHRLTPAGEKARNTGGDLLNTVFDTTLRRLSPDELTTLYALLTKAQGG